MDIVERIKSELNSSPVVLFMKGTPDFPQCGFSAQTVAALRSYAQSAGFDAVSAEWELDQYPVIALNALRALVVASPDYQAC